MAKAKKPRSATYEEKQMGNNSNACRKVGSTFSAPSAGASPPDKVFAIIWTDFLVGKVGHGLNKSAQNQVSCFSVTTGCGGT